VIRAGFVALALVGASALAPGAAAQVDTTRRDTTTARDTTQGRDSTSQDTITVLLPSAALPIAPGPLPAGARYTFTADSLLLSSARTLSDLLAHIPGVYIARAGWYGQAEIPLYGGRGAGAVEIYWDGVPFAPLGRDSLYVDPARIPLAPLERIDVIVMPSTLQVYLVTARQRSTAPRTQVGILTGEQDIAGYRAGYARRSRSGFGIAVVADWNSIGQGGITNTTTSFGASDIWVKAEYVPPGGRLGVSLQLSSASWHRAAGDTVVEGWRQDRRDRLLSVFVAQREDGLGWRFTGTLATSAISHDTLIVPRAVSSATLELRQVWAHATIAGTARFGAGGFPRQLEARGGWLPIRPVTLAGTVRQSFYHDGRWGWRGYLTAGLRLPLGFSARAEGTWQKDVQAALVTTDQPQEALDVAGWLRFDHRLITIEVGRGRRDAFAPLEFARGVSTVRALNPTPLTEFIAGHATLRIVPGLQLSGWYFDPVVGGGDFEPPHHARVAATFYSKFWRVFKSGIFALRGEVAMESWSRWGLGGLDQSGAQRAMTGASFVDTNLELQLAGVTLFWSIQNVNIMRASYVERLGFPKSAQQYGARWFFTN
jgi:hypothetical protein